MRYYDLALPCANLESVYTVLNKFIKSPHSVRFMSQLLQYSAANYQNLSLCFCNGESTGMHQLFNQKKNK